jgi:hypothetical protein
MHGGWQGRLPSRLLQKTTATVGPGRPYLKLLLRLSACGAQCHMAALQNTHLYIRIRVAGDEGFSNFEAQRGE